MSEGSQIAPLNGSMNHDFHPKYVRTDDGHVLSRVNLRTGSTDGKMFVNKKLNGTLHVPITLPTGTNKTIGWCEDPQNEAIIYFVYNSNNNHCVLRYLTHTKVLQKIWHSEPDLSLVDDVLRARVVEGKVYWVNGLEAPKSFNIEYAYNYTNNIVSDKSYTDEDIPFLSNVFSLAKKPPRFAPECIYDADPNYNFNNLRKKLFQFKYAYQYYDDQISAWSPISKVPLPQDEIGVNGEFKTDISVNNIINVTVNTGAKRVKRILVAARDTSPRNAGSFYRFETIEKYNKQGEQVIFDDGDHTVAFYNNKQTESIDTEINNRYCDHVPLSGDDIILLDGKYLGISMPTEGYDGVEPDYTLLPASEDTNFDVTVVPMRTSREPLFLELVPRTYDVIYIPSVFYPNSIYSISFRVNNKNYAFTINTQSSMSGYPRTLRDEFLTIIRARFANEPGIEGALIDNRSKSETGIVLKFYRLTNPNRDDYTLYNLQGAVTVSIGQSIPSYKTLKRGQYHPFGIIYNDDYGRYNIVYSNNELYVPLAESNTNESLGQVVKCQWQIKHRPPNWATSYRWCYLRNKSYSYFQYFAHVKSTLGTGMQAGQNKIPANKYFLELNQSLQRIRDLYPNFYTSDYEWQNGDRIRIVGSQESFEILSPHVWVDEEDPESGINGFLVGEGWPTDANIVLCEVYRQNPTPQDTIYLEVGEEFLILDSGTANRRHQGQFSNQNEALTVPATGIMDFGDVYLRYRLVVNQSFISGAIAIEDEHYNDYYRSDSIDVGRAGAKIDSSQKRLNRIVRSENYLENTEYNLLNVWLPTADYFDASDEYGNITGIDHAGDVLKVVQQHKETSVYVGKNAVKQGDGSDIILATDKVFGTTNRYTEFRGTAYRRSMISNRRYLYYFDESTGEFIRSSPNGQAPISSDYLMESFFEAKAKEMREYNGIKDVVTGINNDHNEVFISFIKGTSIETIVFSEDDATKGWKYFAVLCNPGDTFENMAYYGDTMFLFRKGQLYLFDQGAVPNRFFGVQQGCSLSFYINKFASLQKRFKNIRVSTNSNEWTIRFSIPSGMNYGDQASVLKPTILRERSNQIVSDILRNIISKTGQEDVNLLYNGQRMIGEHMKVEMTSSANSDSELREVEVKFIISS